MSYPNSSPVSAGDPTEAVQYNNLRKDAVYLGNEPGASGTLLDLLYQTAGAIRLSRNGKTGIRLTAGADDPCGVMIDGAIFTAREVLDLTVSADDFPQGGKYGIYAAGQRDGSFRLEAGSETLSGRRRIGSFIWSGSGIIPETVRNEAEEREARRSSRRPAGSGRLTLASGAPVPGFEITDAQTVFFTPWKGNEIGIPTDGGWENFSFGEMALSLSGLDRMVPYDLFITADENGLSLVSERWANAGSRAAELLLRDGIRVSGTDWRKRYLGTIALNASGKGEDSRTGRLLWNENNRVCRPLLARLLSASEQGNVSAGNWIPYYGSEAPELRALIPCSDSDFEIEGTGISCPVTENDRAYQRFSAVGIGADMMKDAPYTGNSSCVPVYTHNWGNGPVSVRIRAGDAAPGLRVFTLAWWSNYSGQYPEGTAFRTACGEAPGLAGYIRG